MSGERLTPQYGFAKNHNPRSLALYQFISDLDADEGNDAFGFKAGGDGDNGEMLMDLLDVYFREHPQ